MTFCQVVIILPGKYASLSKWIDREIQCAKADLDKPVQGVKPWGSELVASFLRENADCLVNWSTGSIVSGIRQIALKSAGRVGKAQHLV
jgi:hypothetical protein